MNNTIELSNFCGQEQRHTGSIDKPFKDGEFTIATNGTLALLKQKIREVVLTVKKG